MAARIRVRELSNEEGNRLLKLVRRDSGSVVTWRRAQMVLLSAQAMDAPQIAQVTFAAEDRVRDVIRNFNRDGFESLYPKYTGGAPPKFDDLQRQRIKQFALSRPADHGLPFSTWSLAKLAEFLVAEGVVDDISHEGLRQLLKQQGVSFQRIKTWKTSNDPDFEKKKNRVLELYQIADGDRRKRRCDPDVVICIDEFGPLNLQPHPGRHWARRQGRAGPAPRRMRATYNRYGGVRHGFGAFDLMRDKMFMHIKPRKTRTEFLEFCRYVRSLYPADIRLAFVLDNFSPHLTTKKDSRVGDWAAANNVEMAYTPTNASWLNRIECQFAGLRYFALDGTDHLTHEAQGSMIRRYLHWRNRHANDAHLTDVINRAKVA